MKAYTDGSSYYFYKTNQMNPNVITNIRNDIKLELSNGVITLKSGSRVYVPDGFEQDGTTLKSTAITLSEDKVLNSTWGSSNVQCALFLKNDGSAIQMASLDRLSAGSTAPTATNVQVWYDTVNNKVHRFSGGNFSNYCSLPFAIVTNVSSGNIGSIDIKFNGFGFMSSAIFCLPEVHGLQPNGFNDDGSYKTTAFSINRVLIRKIDENLTGNFFINLTNSDIARANINNWQYQPDKNFIYYQGSNTNYEWVVQPNRVIVGQFTLSAGIVTSMTMPAVENITTSLYKTLE